MNINLYSFTMDCKDPIALARFYANLLQWRVVFSDEEYACIAPPGTQQGAYPGITFQKNMLYIPPVWPEEAKAQQQMAHLDFAVDNLDKAVRHAIHCGATMADEQFSDGWRVLFDPAGHPFCLCFMKHIFTAGK